MKAYLVSVSPEEVLDSHVLIWVLGALLKRRQVFPMSPMLVPEVVCVDAGDDEGWDGHAVKVI